MVYFVYNHVSLKLLAILLGERPVIDLKNRLKLDGSLKLSR